MKEVIEYILAALIITSFIPIYDIVVTNIYRSSPPIIDYNTLTYISEQVRQVLLETATNGNFTPVLVDFNSLLKNTLNLSEDIGYNIKIYSSGILRVDYQNKLVKVYTTSPGKLYVVTIYSDLTFDSYALLSPTGNLLNGTVYYELVPHRTDVVFISAILETGVARFINYWVSPNIYQVYIINKNNNIIIAFPGNVPTPSTYSILGSNVINATLIYYTNGRYFNYTESFTQFIINLTWWNSTYIIGSGYYKEVHSRYVTTYTNTITYQSRSYDLFKLQNYIRKETYYFTYETVLGQNQILITSKQLVDTEESLNDIMYPIYNLVVIMLKDSKGKIYYAVTYPRAIEIGDPIPEKWIIYQTTYTIRIGMINYDMVIIVWRRHL